MRLLSGLLATRSALLTSSGAFGAPLPAGGDREIALSEYPALKEEARTAEIFAGPPQPVLERHDGMRFHWLIVGFSVLWSRPGPGPGERTSHWVARKSEAKGQTYSVRYADSRSCPALRRVLVSARGLERPSLRLGYLEPSAVELAEGNFLLHGRTYVLAGDGVFESDRTVARLRISGDDLTPLAKWAEDALKQLEPCWSRKPPVIH